MQSIRSKICVLFAGLAMLLISCGSKSQNTTAEKFLDFYNHYQTDSLQNLLADNFIFSRTFISYKNDKASFLKDIQERISKTNSVFIITHTEQKGYVTHFQVKDKSDYFDYLGIDPPGWKLEVHEDAQNKISYCLLDTTESFGRYKTQSEEKYRAFQNWYSSKHPGSENNFPTDMDTLIPLMKEYSKQK